MYVMRITTDFEKKADGSVQAAFTRRGSENQKTALVITYRNVPSLPAVRIDDFATESQALEYIRCVEPTCPRVSLDGDSPKPTPSWQQHLSWLHEQGLESAATGDAPIPEWAKSDPTARETFVINPKKG